MNSEVNQWEYRIFADKFDEIEENIREHAELISTKQIMEVYFITNSNNDFDVKTSDNHLEINRVVTSDSGFEQWQPVHKKSFPLNADFIKSELFPVLNADAPPMQRDDYTFQQFLDELIIRHPALFIVQVSNVLYTFDVAGCAAEVADVVINNSKIRTVCIRSEDTQKLNQTSKYLGIGSYENVNYIKAIKKVIGII